MTSENGNPSEATQDHPRTVERLHRQLVAERKDRLIATIDAAKMPPVLREELTRRVTSTPFDDQGNEKPSLTLGEVVAMFNKYGKHDRNGK